MTDFFSTDAGKFAMVAKQFLEGALTLDEAQAAKGKILFRPTLALAGQGLELLLKACISHNGGVPPTRGSAGHDIPTMWHCGLSAPIRNCVAQNAWIVVQEDRGKATYYDIPNDDEIMPSIDKNVAMLGQLHASSGYPLRYWADPQQLAPCTPFLVRTLHRTADDFVKRPNDFLKL